MKASIVAVGSEMLTPLRIDTNSLTITGRLNAIGFDVRFKAVVGDAVDELATVLETALGLSTLVVCTGGLGPTEDDVTREAIARVLGTPLEPDEVVIERIRSRFERRGRAMPEIALRQALVPRGALVLENDHGTAPGLWLMRDGVGLLVLPGPPREMTPMLDRVIYEQLIPHPGGAALVRRTARITGLMESEVETRAQPMYSPWMSRPIPIATTILTVPGGIELHLAARAASREEADRALDVAVREIQDVLGVVVYSVDGRTLEKVVGDLLSARAWTVATAESCTGGLLMSRLTDVPGSSAYVDSGVVCYSNRAKTEWLGVAEALIAEHGAVSEPVACAMAEGVRARVGASVGIGVTGIAGPGGGTPAKPVGTVAICVATLDEVRVKTFHLFGEREMVKYQSAQAALDMLRRMMVGAEA